jgi:transcriptional regulator with XRE-family HTH domain
MLNYLPSEIHRWIRQDRSPGEILRGLREKRGLTQQALADRVGYSDNIVSRIERDEQPFRNVASVLDFAKALNCTKLEETELIEAFLYSHTKINLWITSRLFIEYPDNSAYQKAFQTALKAVLRQEAVSQERQEQKNNQAKKRRLQPVLGKLAIILMTAVLGGIGVFSAPRLSLQPAAQIVTPTVRPAPLPAPSILFEDDFEDGDLSEWENRNSVGSIISDGSNHILRLENTSDDFVIFLLPHRPWADYAVEASVRIEQSTPTNTDFFMNIRDNADGSYSAALDMETSTTGILAGVNGTFSDLGTRTINLSTNQWVQLRTQAIGDQIAVYINGELMRSVTSSDHLAGTISFSVAPHTIVEIDNVRVIDLSSGS